MQITHEHTECADHVEMISEIIIHCAEKLLTQNQIDDLWIFIGQEDMDWAGASVIYDRDEQIVDLTINFRDSTFDFVLLMICHEMVHIKQFLSGELVQISFRKSLWNNTVINHNETDYFNLPWEKEAYAKEEILLHSYLETIKES